MRSSIACVRCRRSKVKCVNTGPNTTCRACESSNRECTYPAPVQGATPRMLPQPGLGALGVGHAADREGPRKQKPKKLIHPGGSFSTNPASHTGSKVFKEVLESPILTPVLWTQIFEIFQNHHSPTLPFLHPPTFLSRLRVPSSSRPSSSPPPTGEQGHSPLLLLGLLTLTARHVPTLIAYHAPILSTPAAVSDFYASALKYRIANDKDGDTMAAFASPTLEKTQAILMLAMHEWGMCRGAEAYVWLGLAIRMGGVLGLTWDDVKEEPGFANPYISSVLGMVNSDGGKEESSAKRRKIQSGGGGGSTRGKEFVEKEVRRRTFWALFMLDRALSSGRYRPSGITRLEAERVQLPCDERGFLFGEGVRTGYLSFDGDRDGKETNGGDKGERWEVGEDEGILARVVRITEIWGRVQEWACAGGRRTEKHAPWSSSSMFNSLQKSLEDFYTTLPCHLQFSTQTLSAHISSRTASAYATLHITHFLCILILHREYVPFLPLRIQKPQGPLDPPSFPSTNTAIPGLDGVTYSEFWQDSAKEMFRAARGIMQIISGLEEWGSAIETPAIGFAVYMVAVCGVYAWAFPWMDQAGYITGSIPSSDGEDENMTDRDKTPEGTGEEARKAVETVLKMKGRWRMAEGWYQTLGRLKNYFTRVRNEFMRLHSEGPVGNGNSNGESPEAAVARKIKEGFGGGYDEYRRFERLFHDFAAIDEANDVAKHHQHHSHSSPGRASSDPEIKKESEVDALLAAAEGITTSAIDAPGADRWMAINTPRTVSSKLAHQTSSGHLASLASYAAGQQPIPTPPNNGRAPASGHTNLSPPLSYASLNGPSSSTAGEGGPQLVIDLEQQQRIEEERRAHEQMQLQREMERGEKLGVAEDLLGFVNGIGVEEWNGGMSDGWMGRVWEKQ